ncbi:hypothetical protein GCM10023162_21250 [Klenkia terrae]
MPRPRPGYPVWMAADQQTFHPGQIVPRSGIYRCTEGHGVPPLPDGCRGEGWVLERAAGQH